MAQSIQMPALGESVTEGTVTAWLKQVGDAVEADEPIVEVATDKVDSEVPSPIAGVLLEILVQEDDTVAVGTEIARVGDASELGGSAAAPAPEAAAAPAEVAAEVPAEPAPAVESAPEPAAPAAAPAASGSVTEVKMPALGESVTEGTVTAWLKHVGDAVEADEPIVEVATDKVDSEVPSPVAGFLAEIRAEEDETVSVGSVIAVISSEQGAPVAAAPAPAEPAAEAPAPVAEAAPAPVAAPQPPTPPAVPAYVAPPLPGSVPAPAVPSAPAPAWTNAPAATPVPDDPQAVIDAEATRVAAAGKIVAPAEKSLPLSSGYVTPLVRKMARELGVDLATVTGSGVGGRIRKEDVQAAAQAAQAAVSEPVATPSIEPDPLRGTTEKMSRLRQTIARRMVESLQTAAQLTTVVEVDVTKVAALRAKHKDAFQQAHGTKLTFLPFFVKAATEALLTHPKINAQISDNQVTYFDYENIGIAVDAPKGLMVPVIKHAGEMNLAGLAESINTLAEKTREGTVSPDDLTGSTFTITNTGSGGALFDTPVLNMPEVAILGVGAIVRRPVVVRDADGNESISIHSMVYLSLSYDHRLVDGADAARYLQAVKKRLEAADFEADLGL